MFWWLVFVIAYAVVMLTVWWRQGPRRAITAGVLLALLVPEWVRWYPMESGGVLPEGAQFNTASVWINVRVAVGILGVCLYMLHSKSTYNWKLMWSDWAMFGLMGTHLVSDSLANSFELTTLGTTLLRMYGEWFLPYIAGRIAIQSIGDARWALPLAVGVTLVMASFSLVESITKINPNPFEWALLNVTDGVPQATPRPEDGTPRDADRIGFKRSYGPTMHPIYFATLQLLLLPWMIYAASRSMKVRSLPFWWGAMPVVCVVGMAGPISRAPLLAIGILIYVMVMIFRPQNRRTMGIVAGVCAAVLALDVMLNTNVILGALEKFTGEDTHSKEVVIDGKKVKYTGTRHRFLLFEEYANAMWSGGPFGWGTSRVSTFPPDVPRASDRPAPPMVDLTAPETPAPAQPLDMTGQGRKMHQRRSTITVLPPGVTEAQVATLDNSFILFTLRFGYLGLLFFTAVVALGAWNYIRLATVPNAEGAAWLAAMAGTLVAMAFVLFTVWMPQDFGFFYIWLIGASAGLLAEKENPQLPSVEPQKNSRRKHRRRRRSQRPEAWEEPVSQEHVSKESPS